MLVRLKFGNYLFTESTLKLKREKLIETETWNSILEKTIMEKV